MYRVCWWFAKVNMKVAKIYINSVCAHESPPNPQEKFIIELSIALGLTVSDCLYIREIEQYNKDTQKYETVFDLYFNDFNNFHFKFKR